MHRSHILSRPRATLAVAGTLALLLGCSSAPQHSNTLIFGTSTRLAIDASQEPTGALGVTIGYKRHEAVWMPLLANEEVGESAKPAKCEHDKCRVFAGETGAGGGAAGAGAKDTYSVLATFSGDMAGSAQNAQAQVGVAQYFATGFAARLLAQYGGAAAVGAAASAPTDAALRAGASKIAKVQEDQVATIGARLSKTDGSLKSDLLTKVFTADPAKMVTAGDQQRIKSFTTRAELEEYLSLAPEDVAQKIFMTLDSI